MMSNDAQNIDRGLFYAAGRGDYPTVKLLLQQGAEVNEAHGPVRWSALHNAANAGKTAQEGCLQIVRILLQKGADPMMRDITGHLPVDVAVKQNNREIVNLIQSLASKSEDGSETVKHASAEDPESQAIDEADDEIEKPTKPKKKKKMFFTLPPPKPAPPSPEDKFAVARLLVRRGAEVNAVDMCGNTMYSYASQTFPGEMERIDDLLAEFGFSFKDHRSLSFRMGSSNSKHQSRPPKRIAVVATWSEGIQESLFDAAAEGELAHLKKIFTQATCSIDVANVAPYQAEQTLLHIAAFHGKRNSS